MAFNANEIQVLKKLHNITKNFKVEIYGTINQIKSSYQIHFIGSENEVNSYADEQDNFHNHPGGFPPSITDIQVNFSEIQRTDYIIGKKYTYRICEFEQDENMLEKLEEDPAFYIYLCHKLMCNQITPLEFQGYCQIKYGLCISILKN